MQSTQTSAATGARWAGLSRRPDSAPRPQRRSRLADQLAEAGLTGISQVQLILLQLLCTVMAFGVVLAATGSLAVAGVFATFGAVVPRLVVSRLRNKRQAELREVWPEVVDNLTSGVRAGLSLPEALAAVGTRGPEAIRQPFLAFGADYPTGGPDRSTPTNDKSVGDPDRSAAWKDDLGSSEVLQVRILVDQQILEPAEAIRSNERSLVRGDRTEPCHQDVGLVDALHSTIIGKVDRLRYHKGCQQ